ncbi:MAG TPA: sigma-54-dependent Fis family transcriptional regulator [Nitrospirae bacterium]|nr:sigma-54-dependent Fis family transcriptional regulator [Nitrospirota bacterium]
MARDTVLIVDDEEGIRESLSGILEDDGYSVLTASSGEDAISRLTEIQPDIIFLDIWLTGISGLDTLSKIKNINSDIPVIMISGHGNIEMAVNAIKMGAYDFLEKPLSLEKVLLVASRAIEKKRLKEENRNLKAFMKNQNILIGSSSVMQKLREQIELAGRSNGRVLILGESGTGKEIAARLLHEKGNRSNFPFVEVNCAAIPQELIESELFGHEKGAFTGASERKIGKFELADKGTLFLDEIGDMSLQTQAKVLRVIETQFFQRVGGSKNISVDVRIISATNKNLQEDVKNQRFREDLYFRLNVIPLQLPTLREKREDIPELIEYFVNKFSIDNGVKAKTFSKDLIKIFMEYDWPGNIRELKNTVERLLIMVPQEVITIRDAERLGVCENSVNARGNQFFNYSTLKEAKDAFEAEFIKRKLKEHNWNISRTADAIDVERSSLHKKIKSLNIVETE